MWNDVVAFITLPPGHPTRHSCQPQRIHPPHRIGRILIQVLAPQQPNRILTNKPPDVRIVVPEPVVVQSGLAVVVLALEAQGLQAWRVLRHGPSPGDLDGVPPGLVDGFPDSFSFAVGQFPGVPRWSLW